jgi:hypothetical protein
MKSLEAVSVPSMSAVHISMSETVSSHLVGGVAVAHAPLSRAFSMASARMVKKSLGVETRIGEEHVQLKDSTCPPEICVQLFLNLEWWSLNARCHFPEADCATVVRREGEIWISLLISKRESPVLSEESG